MRDIKFRAWDRQSKFWVDERNAVLCPDGEVLIRPDADVDEWDSGGPIDIVFFTGLPDKNGEEISGVDILKDRHGRLWNIIWHDGCYWIAAAIGMERLKGRTIENYRLEVIGNTWENPELLKS